MNSNSNARFSNTYLEDSVILDNATCKLHDHDLLPTTMVRVKSNLWQRAKHRRTGKLDYSFLLEHYKQGGRLVIHDWKTGEYHKYYFLGEKKALSPEEYQELLAKRRQQELLERQEQERLEVYMESIRRKLTLNTDEQGAICAPQCGIVPTTNHCTEQDIGCELVEKFFELFPTRYSKEDGVNKYYSIRRALTCIPGLSIVQPISSDLLPHRPSECGLPVTLDNLITGDVMCSSKSTLLIPCHSPFAKKAVYTVQLIDPNGNKLFMKDGKKAGSCFTFFKAVDKETQIVILAEGLATSYAVAAMVYQACKSPLTMVNPNSIVVACCFDAGNLGRVAAQLRQHYPNIKIVIAADNDHKNNLNPEYVKTVDFIENNTGVKSALMFSKLYNTSVLIPPAIPDISDWFDMFCICLNRGVEVLNSLILAFSEFLNDVALNNISIIVNPYKPETQNYYLAKQFLNEQLKPFHTHKGFVL